MTKGVLVGLDLFLRRQTSARKFVGPTGTYKDSQNEGKPLSPRRRGKSGAVTNAAALDNSSCRRSSNKLGGPM